MSLNTKIAGNGATPSLYAKCIKCNSPHKFEHYRDMVWYCKINFKTNPLRLKTKKESSVLTLSTIKASIKWIAICIFSRNIGLTRSGTQRNIKSYMTTEANQSTQLWVKYVYNYKKPKDLFAEHLNELTSHWYNPRKLQKFWYCLHLRTSMVYYLVCS